MHNNTTCIQPSMISSTALPIAYFFLSIIGLFGNSLAQWLFLTKIGMKTSTHVYLANLVTANLLVCCAMPFMGIYFLKGFQWDYESVQCKAVNFLGTLSMHVSMFISLLIFNWIAISRYATLMKKESMQEITSCFERIFYGHLLKRFRKANFARKMCIYIWGVVLVIIIPITIYYLVAEATKGGENLCYNRQIELGAMISQVAGLIGTTFIGFSFLVVVTSYYSFVRHLRKVKTCTSTIEKDLTYRSVKRHLLIIQVLLIVCFLPYTIFKPIFYVLHQRDDCQQLNYLIEAKNILTCLASARSSTDPIIFLLLDKTFKKTLYNLLKNRNSSHMHTYD